MNIDRPKIVLLYQSLLGIYGDHRDLHLSIRRQRQMCIRDSISSGHFFIIYVPFP